MLLGILTPCVLLKSGTIDSCTLGSDLAGEADRALAPPYVTFVLLLFRSHIAILVLLQMSDSFASFTLLQQWSVVMDQLHNVQNCMVLSYVLFSILSMTKRCFRRIFVNLLP